jgi:glutamine synthetase type III
MCYLGFTLGFAYTIFWLVLLGRSTFQQIKEIIVYKAKKVLENKKLPGKLWEKINSKLASEGMTEIENSASRLIKTENEIPEQARRAAERLDKAKGELKASTNTTLYDRFKDRNTTIKTAVSSIRKFTDKNETIISEPPSKLF